MAAISGAHALLTNIVLAWNTNRMDGVVARLKHDGVGIEVDWLRRVGPAHVTHINFRGTFRFKAERYADVCWHCGHALVILQTFTRSHAIRAPPAGRTR